MRDAVKDRELDDDDVTGSINTCLINNYIGQFYIILTDYFKLFTITRDLRG